MPYAGVNWRHGFHVAGLEEVDDVQNAMCHTCSWDGNCGFIPKCVIRISFSCMNLVLIKLFFHL